MRRLRLKAKAKGYSLKAKGCSLRGVRAKARAMHLSPKEDSRNGSQRIVRLLCITVLGIHCGELLNICTQQRKQMRGEWM